MADELTDDQVNQIQSRLAAGHKLAAVKLYKDLTGSSLVTAKNYVEQLAAGHPTGNDDFGKGLEANQLDQILDAIQQGQKLQAVKLYRSSSGLSLKESKDFIERLMKELEIDDPGSAAGASGCAAMILLMLVLASVVLITIR